MLPASYLRGEYFYTIDQIEAANAQTVQIDTVEVAEAYCAWLLELAARNVPVALDTEYDGVDLDKENVIGRGTIITFQFTAGVDGNWTRIWVDARVPGVMEAFAPFLTCPARTKVVHNFISEYHVFANHGINMKGLLCDTLALSRLCDPEREGGHHLDGDQGLAVGLLGLPPGSRPGTRQALDVYKVLKNGGQAKGTYFPGMRAIVADAGMLPFQKFYACNDTDDTLGLMLRLIPMLTEIPWNDDARGLWGYYEDLQRDFQETLVVVMRRGILLDMDYLEVVKERFLAHMDTLKQKFNEWAGCEVNLDSPPQLSWLLYGDGWKEITKAKIPIYGHGLPIPGIKKKDRDKRDAFLAGEAQNPSTDAAARAYLLENTQGEDFEAINRLTEYSKHDTIVTLTIQSMQDKNIARHASRYREYDPAMSWARYIHGLLDIGTATGRLNCVKPNLQQIPSRGLLGAIARHAFTCEPGELMIVGDWSQVELRILAYYAKILCGDTSLALDLVSGDLHKNTAEKLAKILGRPIERTVAKSVNFGINYGMTAMKLSADLGISFADAELIINTYLQIYPGIDAYTEEIIRFARENGYVRTLFGRIRVLKNITARFAGARSKDERRARNTPIQGSAQDICGAAMVVLENDEELRDYGYQQLLQVHDEIVGKTTKPQFEQQIIRRKKEIMETIVPPEMMADIPLVAEVYSGTTWQEAKSGKAFADLSKIAA